MLHKHMLYGSFFAVFIAFFVSDGKNVFSLLEPHTTLYKRQSSFLYTFYHVCLLLKTYYMRICIHTYIPVTQSHHHYFEN